MAGLGTGRTLRDELRAARDELGASRDELGASRTQSAPTEAMDGEAEAAWAIGGLAAAGSARFARLMEGTATGGASALGGARAGSGLGAGGGRIAEAGRPVTVNLAVHTVGTAGARELARR